MDKNHLLVISPDEGALDRAVYFANVLGVDTGMFYKRFQPVGEQAEGAADKDSSGIHLLQLLGGVQHTLAGGDNVVNDDNVFAVDIVPQEFMGHNGVSSVDDGGIIPALVEHARVHPQDISMRAASTREAAGNPWTAPMR